MVSTSPKSSLDETPVSAKPSFRLGGPTVATGAVGVLVVRT